jgi:SpoVK/Ycf46/Vps4 family AAA+-type ATPase
MVNVYAEDRIPTRRVGSKIMSTPQHIIALLRSHLEGDDEQFLAIAVQAAAKEARQGHVQVAQEIRDLVDNARNRSSHQLLKRHVPNQEGVTNDDLGGLLSISESQLRLGDLVLPKALEERLSKVVLEQRQRDKLLFYNLHPRSKLLFVGPPGTGKTMTAHALAGELHLPLFSVLLEGLITKFMGETAVKLRQIFDAMALTPGVYFFDEFDAIGTKRSATNDVGEIRRVLNSFLQFLENASSKSLIVAATNHPELLDPALSRRFDDVIEYNLPDQEVAERILRTNLSYVDTKRVKWPEILEAIHGLSQAEVAKIGIEASKIAILNNKKTLSNKEILQALVDRPSKRLNSFVTDA